MPTKVPEIRSQYRWRVKHRLRVLAYADAHSLKAASRHFGLERKTIRRWRDRYRVQGVLGLVPRYPIQRPSRLPVETLRLIEHARRELEYGAGRTQVWLWRVHRIRLHRTTLTQIFRRLGLPHLPRRRKRATRPRQLRLFEKPEPGDSVQIDVKHVKIRGQRAYQYTALDDCTRVRVLRLFRHLGLRSTLTFLADVRRRLPFAIRKIQTDHGPEFPLEFVLAIQEAGIRHQYIRPRRPQQNGKVERSHRIDQEEFWGRRHFETFLEADTALQAWERVYNLERFSLALHGETPAEKLARLRPGTLAA
jgi:transposase InsO family protein